MIAIIGAGVAGLSSALTLQKLGHKIILIDKGRSVGGRMATRYFEQDGVRRYIDTAAHYVDLTPESPSFNSLMSNLFPEQKSASRIKGPRGVNSIAKKMADSLDSVEVLLSHKVTSIQYNSENRKFSIDATSRQSSTQSIVDAIILTAPVPQSIDLLSKYPDLVATLQKAPAYHKYLLLLLWPKQVVKKGDLHHPAAIDSIIYQIQITENEEPIPIAIHATHDWSNKHYGLQDEEIKRLMMDIVKVDEKLYDCIQVKRWVCLINSACPSQSLTHTGTSTTHRRRSIFSRVRHR